jgi:hypothetical protein
MCVSRWLLIAAVLLAGGAVPQRDAVAASINRAKQAARGVKAPAKLPKVNSQAVRPASPRRPASIRLPQSAAKSSKTAARSSSAPRAAARTSAPAQPLRQGSMINQAELRSRLKASRLTDVSRVADRVASVRGTAADVAQRPGQVGSAGNNSFTGISSRAKNIRTSTAEQARGANSSTLRGLESVMPGFRDRARGGSSIRDLAGGSANRRNPVTTGSSLGNFAGGGSGQFSDDGGIISAQKKKNGDIVIVTEKGDIVTRYKNGDRGVNKPNGDTEYTFAERKVEGRPTASHPIEPLSPSGGGKQGSQKEPTPDDTTDTSGSVPRYVSAAQLRGLAAMRGSRGEPTGDEPTSGGTIDKSKTRQGRNAQMGEPINDVEAATAFLPDRVQVKQALTIRLRNVTPIPE